MSAAASSSGRRRAAAGRIISALDIGSHKVCCLIGEVVSATSTTGETVQRFRPLGFGHQRAQGIAAGALVDLKTARAAVSATLAQAENAAGIGVENLVVSVSCGDARSLTFTGHVETPDGMVSAGDIERLDTGAREFATRDGLALLSLNRIAFQLDKVSGVAAPLGLAGHHLSANHHAVTVEPGALRNLCLLVESCQVEPSILLPTGYASALAATTPTERQVGTTCIDIGAGIASLAGFADGHFVFTATVPVGGQQVTEDLARYLAVPLAEAERIKTLYGNLILTASDEHEIVPLAREGDGMSPLPATSRAEIGRIVADSMRRVLWRIRECLDSCPVARAKTGNVVLTGGTSEFVGFEEFATFELGRPVRIAAAPRFDGAAGRLPGGVSSPAFSCVAGLALAAASPPSWIGAHNAPSAARPGYLGRVERWLRESF